MAARILSLFVTFYILLFTFVAVVQAQTPASRSATPSATNQELIGWSQRAEYVVAGLIHTFSCLGAGIPITQATCFGVTIPLTNANTSSSGALGLIGQMFSALVLTPPVHSPNYLASLGSNLGLVTPAYAQVGGTGQSVINIVLTLWQISRNISYIVMIIIFVVIGLMVMFRQKINPQTVITVQSALPGLVIGLILITFSYFIAALLVDVGFLATWLVGFYFIQTQPAGTVNPTGTILLDQNVITLFNAFINVGNNEILEAFVNSVMSGIIDPASRVIRSAAVFIACQHGVNIAGSIPFGGIVACLLAGGTAAANPPWVIGWFLYVVVLFVLIVAMIRLLMRLLNNYIQILLLTFTAPFNFLVASLPGRQGIAMDWVRNMLCNVLAFPGVFAAFYFAGYLIGSDPRATNTTNPGTPGVVQLFNFVRDPVTGHLLTLPNSLQTMPLLGGLDSVFVRFLLAFGVLVATPAIPDAICSVIGKIGPAGQIVGKGIQENIAGGQGQLGKVVDTAGSLKGIKLKLGKT